uniref:Reverse transcriptase RNase H-like domain-containing protein n=1 Tax=Cajanus cajan TaxID=3821 RepID=A0A151RY90_CAJCA|nr:hypothetical protein KK1_030859 [Cajanus cajan]
MLVQKDEKKIEIAIYYLSRILIEAEVRYALLENFIYIYYSCTKLKYYIKPLDVIVFCHNNIIKCMLSKPILHYRESTWTLALIEYSLTFSPLKSMKGQIIADFLIDLTSKVEEVQYLAIKFRLYISMD